MIRRFIPASLLIVGLATLAACADTTAPTAKNDCVVIAGVLSCWP